MRGHIQPPCNVPTLEFWVQFCPLLGDANGVLPLMVKQHGGRLNHSLNQENLPLWGVSVLERIPQILP